MRRSLVLEKPRPVLTLAEPFSLAHRGGSNIRPENTAVAFRNATSLGRGIEFDVHLLADNGLGIQHDTTVDRTTTSSGNVVSLTTAQFKALVVDTSGWFGSSAYGNLTPPVPEDVFKELGGRTMLVPEAKTTQTVPFLIAAVKRARLEKACIIQAGFTDCTRILAAGITPLYLSDSADPAATVAAGIKYVGVSTAVSDAYVSSLTAVGLKPVVFPINRQVDRDAWIAKGVVGYFSDDPIYTSGDLARYRRTTDPFSLQTWYHGMIKSSTGSRGVFVGGDRWGLTATGKSFLLQGWNCPVGGASIPSGYTISYTIKVDAVAGAGDTNSHADIFACAPTDVEYLDSGAATENGYNFILRRSGRMEVYRRVNGTSTNPINVAGTALSAGQEIPMELQVVDANTIKFRRTDIPQEVTLTDSTHRGGYWHHGGNITVSGTQFSFKTVTSV